MTAMTTIQAIWLLVVMGADFTARRVRNGLVLLGAALALGALSFGIHPAGLSWVDALGAGALAFCTLLLFYAAGLMGAGDVKFAGALGLWVGLNGLLPIWIVSSLLACLHGLALLALQRWPVWPRLALALLSPADRKASDGTRRKRRRQVPYAAYLAIATLMWMVWKQPA